MASTGWSVSGERVELEKLKFKLLAEALKRQDVHRHISLNQLDTLCTGTRFLSLEELGCDEDPVHRLNQKSQLMSRESAQA